MSPRHALDRLRDIVVAAERIGRHTATMAGVSYQENPAGADVYIDAVHYQLIVIGEALAALPDEVKDQDPTIPWRAIVGLRNRLAHEYFQVEPELIREVVHQDLVVLERKVGALMDALLP